MAQNHISTDGHGEYMTESAQWGRFSENTFTPESLTMAFFWPNNIEGIVIALLCLSSLLDLSFELFATESK